jgi:hypothetical protein
VAPRGETGNVSRAFSSTKRKRSPARRNDAAASGRSRSTKIAHAMAKPWVFASARGGLLGAIPICFNWNTMPTPLPPAFAEQEGMCARCRGEQPRP